MLIWASFPAVTTRYPKNHNIILPYFWDELRHAVPSGMRSAQKNLWITIENSYNITRFAKEKCGLLIRLVAGRKVRTPEGSIADNIRHL